MDADAEKRDAELKTLLEERLPRYAAPYSLRHRLAGAVTERATRGQRRGPAILAALGVAAAAALVLLISRPRLDPVEASVDEHVRLLARAQPVDVPNGGLHQVKPWFTGKLDFAPRVAFSGDEEFPLIGGSLAELRGRRAAAFVWKRRLHTITLFVYRAEGTRAPRGDKIIGPLSVEERVQRGFDALAWRDGDLGYTLVSDVSRADLEALAARIAGTR
jgi:anti-sigma factor RsiW